MAVRFRIDATDDPFLPQGVPDQSRHDLGHSRVRLTVVEPAPAPGITYKWRILDQAGLPGLPGYENGTDTSTVVDLTIYPEAYAWSILIELQAFQDGVLLGATRRIASCLTPLRGLRLPLFGETADPLANFSDRRTISSTDNAVYDDRGSGYEDEQNWRGWTELLHRLTLAVEHLRFYEGTPASLGTGAPVTLGDSPLPARGNHSHAIEFGDAAYFRKGAAYFSWPGTVSGIAHVDHTHGGQEWTVVGIGDSGTQPLHENVLYTYGRYYYDDPTNIWHPFGLPANGDRIDYLLKGLGPTGTLLGDGHVTAVWNGRCHFVVRVSEGCAFKLPKQSLIIGNDWDHLVDVSYGREIAGVQAGPGPITFEASDGVAIHSNTGYATAGVGSRFHLMRSRRWVTEYGENAESGTDHWDLVIYGPTEGGSGGPSLPGATGDLSGDYPGLTVIGLRGDPISVIAPETAQVLTFEDNQWRPRDQRASMSGDVVGRTDDSEVRGLWNRPISLDTNILTPGISNEVDGHYFVFRRTVHGEFWDVRALHILDVPVVGAAPTDGQVLIYKAAAGEVAAHWEAQTVSGLGAFAGDVEGLSDATEVVALRGRPVGDLEPEIEHVLTWTGSAWEPSQLPETRVLGSLAGGGAPEHGEVLTFIVDGETSRWEAREAPGAAASLELGGDLDGTAAAATVVGLNGNPLVTNAWYPYDGVYLTYVDGLGWLPGEIRIYGYPIHGAEPTEGQVLTFRADQGEGNLAHWEAASPESGGGDAVTLQGQPVAEDEPELGQVLAFLPTGSEGAGQWTPAPMPAPELPPDWELKLAVDLRHGHDWSGGPLTEGSWISSYAGEFLDFAIHGPGTAELVEGVGLRLNPRQDLPTSWDDTATDGIAVSLQSIEIDPFSDLMVYIRIAGANEGEPWNPGDWAGIHVGFPSFDGSLLQFDGAFRAKQVAAQYGVTADDPELRLVVGSDKLAIPPDELPEPIEPGTGLLGLHLKGMTEVRLASQAYYAGEDGVEPPYGEAQNEVAFASRTIGIMPREVERFVGFHAASQLSGSPTLNGVVITHIWVLERRPWRAPDLEALPEPPEGGGGGPNVVTMTVYLNNMDDEGDVETAIQAHYSLLAPGEPSYQSTIAGIVMGIGAGGFVSWVSPEEPETEEDTLTLGTITFEPSGEG